VVINMEAERMTLAALFERSAVDNGLSPANGLPTIDIQDVAARTLVREIISLKYGKSTMRYDIFDAYFAGCIWKCPPKPPSSSTWSEALLMFLIL